MRANTNIALKERRTVTLTDFRGVDLTTSPLRVAPHRATFMRNLINDHGINHKRPGWSEMLRLDGRINGVFPYQNGEHDVLLVHAGNAFYRATYNEATGLWSPVLISEDGWGLTDTRSQCVYRGGVAYILGCGNYLAYGKHNGEDYSLVPVSEIAYVPTTTIGAKSVPNADFSSYIPGATLDAVNLLTPWRKNTAVGPNDLNDETESNTFIVLDGPIDKDTKVTVEVEEARGAEGSGTGTFSYTLQSKDDRLVCISTSNSNIVKEGDDVGSVDRSADFIVMKGKGYLTINRSCRTPIKDIANITVTFSSSVEGYTNRVHKAKFGALFGEGGKADRLFVGGNPDHPDMDFWSAENDFTYFPDGNTMVIGGDQRPMTGYARLSDSVLAIFKESLVGEPSIYYRTGKTTTQIDADGDTIPADYFPITAGTAGDGSVSHHAVANLGGDVLILSQDGVRGVELSANVSSGERYTRDRGRAIYEDLRKKTLSEAVGTVWRGRYFLACGDGTCYVADSRYKTTFEGSPDTQYEWWVWDNVPARVFAVYKDRLLFGDADGKVCGFVEGSFADRECLALESGAVLVAKNGTLDYANDLNLEVGDRVVLTGGVYDRVATAAYDASKMAYVGDVSRLYDGMSILLYGEEGEYTVDEVDAAEETFVLRDKNGDPWSGSGDIALLVPLDGVPLYVADDADPATLARGYGFGKSGERVWDKVFLTTRNESSATWTGHYMRVHPVKAEWVTPVLDLGTNAYSKSLLSLTVATEPGIDGTVTFGYETRRVLRHVEAGRSLAISTEAGATVVGGGEGFSFDDIDFNQFSFDTAFACSYTRRMNLRNFNFITFRFGSDSERDCAVSSAMVTYKINRKNRGVR